MSLKSVATSIVETVERKDKEYGASWKKRGGVGAYMMLARKWDRIENISKGQHYDIFQALSDNTGDVRDDVRDLVGYLLLVLDHMENPGEEVHLPGYSGYLPPDPVDKPFTTEGHRGDGNNLYKCKECKKEVWAKTMFEAMKEHHHDPV